MFFFVGSYTETGSPALDPIGTGITSCSFDPLTGRIKIISGQFQRNPSYPIVSGGGKILYAAEEMFGSERPRLVSYKILNNGGLYKLNEVPLIGDYACHLAIANQTILVANYISSDVLVYSLEEGGQIGSLYQRICHTGSGVNKHRQDAPHPHMLYPHDNDTIYCVDLGIDRVKIYCMGTVTRKWKAVAKLDIKIRPGAGARHIDIDEKREWLVLIGELSGELFLFRKIGTRFRLFDTCSLEDKEMSAAAIRMHVNGRFIYFSERKTNCIYAFKIIGNKLKSIGKFPSGGRTPRDIAFDPSGKWLLAANQDDNAIAVFSIDELTGELKLKNSYDIPTPTCICWQTHSTHNRMVSLSGTQAI